MAEQKHAPVNATGAHCFKEAVCIDAGRIYDSCTDKDCLTDLQVYFTDRAQPVIDSAISVKCKEVEIITVYVDVEPVPFNKGFYSVDLTFFFKVTLGVYCSPASPASTVVGVAAFSKKVILFGSDGNVKVFCSTDARNCCDHDNTNMPKASVHVVDPMCQDNKLVDCSCNNAWDCCGVNIPASVCCKFDGDFNCVKPQKAVLITIGLFTIVQLERCVQMMIPAYDFAVPDKESTNTTADDPCEIFKKIKFPVSQFFPPKLSDVEQM